MIKRNFTKYKLLNENSYKHTCKKKRRRIQAASQKVIHKSKPVSWAQAATSHLQVPSLARIPYWELSTPGKMLGTRLQVLGVCLLGSLNGS